jgi:hypothetical protein
MLGGIVIVVPKPDKPEELFDIRFWSLARGFFRLSGDGCGCEARVGIRKTVAVKKDRNRTALNEIRLRRTQPNND